VPQSLKAWPAGRDHPRPCRSHFGAGRITICPYPLTGAEASRDEILSDFAHYPVVQEYTTKQLEQFFGIKGPKVIGFEKSELAQSLYAGLKGCRIVKAEGDPS
jgi:hypothetical protein